MALIKCPICGSMISDKAEYCSICGTSIDDVLNGCVMEEETIALSEGTTNEPKYSSQNECITDFESSKEFENNEEASLLSTDRDAKVVENKTVNKAAFVVLAMAVFYVLYMFSSSDPDVTGTYNFYDGGYCFNLILNEDGSARITHADKGGTYGSWQYIDFDNHNGCYLTFDSDTRFLFNFDSPFLDLDTYRLYVDFSSYKSKRPNSYYEVYKRN